MAVLSKPIDLLSVCDDLAEELLVAAEWEDDAVDALGVAERLGYDVAFDRRQMIRGRFKRLAGRPALFLQPDSRPERLHWAAARQIGACLLPEICERLMLDPAQISAQAQDQIAARFAGALLLPRRTFDADVTRFHGDVLALKRIYRTASHELILFTQFRLGELMVASVFDQGMLTRRRSNGVLPAPTLRDGELVLQKSVHETGRPAEWRNSLIHVQAWPIHEAGWKRELLRMTPVRAALREDSEWPDPVEFEAEADVPCDGSSSGR